MACLKGGRVRQSTGAVASTTVNEVLVTDPGQVTSKPARPNRQEQPAEAGTESPEAPVQDGKGGGESCLV